MDRSLEGQRALVTGASSGIGAAVSVALGKAGARVVVNYLSSSGDLADAEQVVQAVEAAGSASVAVQGDVSVPEDCDRMVEAAEQNFGGLDILVGNAGIQWDAAFGEMTADQWRKVIDVNLTGQFLCAQRAVASFRRQGMQPERSAALGKVIFINSVHQDIPWAGHVNYAASKGGLKLLMESMAQELAGDRIRVNAIAPGAIKTSINRKAWETEEAVNDLLALIPYGRIGEPDDIGRSVVWLASDAADYVVGTTLFVDGGMTLYPGFREGG